MTSYTALARSVTRRHVPIINPRARGAIPSIVGGAAGYYLWPAHPVLGALGVSAAVRSAVGLLAGDVEPGEAARTIGANAVATGGALALGPIGYLIGAAASGAVLGDAGGGAPGMYDAAVDPMGAGVGDYRDAPTVEAVQKKLRANFAPAAKLKVDGKYGPETAAAVRAFQQYVSSPSVTGVIDNRVLAALAIPAPKPADGRPARGWSQPQVVDRGGMVTPSQPGPGTALVKSTAAPAETGGAFLEYMRRPLWQGAPITVGQAALAGAGTIVLGVGIYVAVR